MVKQIICCLTILTFVSCEDNTEEQSSNPVQRTMTDTSSVINGPRNKLNIQTTMFTEIDSSGILMFPLSMGENKSDEGSSYKELPKTTFWNIIFYNSKTGENHLLSEKKMLISSYDSRNTRSENRNLMVFGKYIFYTIIADDLNKDKLLTDEDPAYLFISDKEGKNFRQISPANYSLVTWQFIKSVNKVLLTVRKDSDNNKKFNVDDEITTFEIDIDKDIQSREIFSTDFKNKLKLLYDRDWKRVKQ